MLPTIAYPKPSQWSLTGASKDTEEIDEIDETSPSLSLTSSADPRESNYEHTPIWAGYQNIKSYFPNVSVVKENFFRHLSSELPAAENPEIQSYDGEYIDILWDDLVVSVTDCDGLSASTSSENIRYFDSCIDALEFIKCCRRVL